VRLFVEGLTATSGRKVGAVRPGLIHWRPEHCYDVPALFVLMVVATPSRRCAERLGLWRPELSFV